MTGDDGDKEAARNRQVKSEFELERAKAVEVLAELYKLLEDYGPSWYGEDLHHRAAAALRVLQES